MRCAAWSATDPNEQGWWHSLISVCVRPKWTKKEHMLSKMDLADGDALKRERERERE
jgi:hypothetical protein